MTNETTIRMLYPKQENTLDGYVFSNMEHARQWLAQPFVDPSEIRLEEVQVGELCRCRYCGGSGFRQSVNVVRKLTVAEFLKGSADAKS